LNFQGRVHLVVTCDGGTRSYFVLRHGSEERRNLINDLIEASRNYDGLQIDFENVPERSLNDYFTFLRELREKLPHNKMFTVALAARTRKLQTDVYDYERILPVVDRILVMAYDEHWSGSQPGPVASIAWCRRVAEYCYRVIGQEKLIMGLPFYGRAWGDYTPSRALIYSTIEGIIKDENVTDVRYENGIPVFSYNKNVSIKLYFDNEYSLTSRLQMYKALNITSVGFWRQGQETPEIWKYIRLSR
jgi:spore germination protein YaaH